ncbi:hypothetical protein P775_12160 [Puniceibacterium antarcticum]|uniref:Uncharacterized protein n=1 Tax=Puniceibacterium antarcticum TaxID=1206336 RepID=A0A2G8REI0_9RHOB|nr:hypothetical protein P775_12160 [Puniceibacterium antarcticum]
MFDIKLDEMHPASRDAECLPEGSGLALCGLGSVMTLALIAVALITGKPLWVIVTLWIAVGPAIIFGLALVAVSWAHVPRSFGVDSTLLSQEGRARHV